MSNTKSTNLNDIKFAKRFAEICQTSKPAEVARNLDISYPAAKNYLNGKIPNTPTIIHISEVTSCSIDWLLRGIGNKFIENNGYQDTPQPSGELKRLIRDECKKVFAEMMNVQTETEKEKVIVLRPEDIKEEKVLDESPVLPMQNK